MLSIQHRTYEDVLRYASFERHQIEQIRPGFVSYQKQFSMAISQRARLSGLLRLETCGMKSRTQRFTSIRCVGKVLVFNVRRGDLQRILVSTAEHHIRHECENGVRRARYQRASG